MTRHHSESGFSLIELLVATGLLLVISSIVTGAIVQMTNAQRTIFNRTDMHSGIRGATELLQQEVGQAGRISLPARITLQQAVNPVGGAAPAASTLCNAATPAVGAATVKVQGDNPALNAVAGIFATGGSGAAYELLTILDGDSEETIKIAAVNAGASTISACFTNAHAAGARLVALGGFAAGIIPPAVGGSSATVLKMYGDINGDGRMVYVEYTCDTTTTHRLYRNIMPFDTPPANKPLLTTSHVLLDNIIPNPGSPPTDCFTYQTAALTIQGAPFTFVLDVALTLTVETEQIDPITKLKQTETKALLNVSPRNVFHAWTLAGIGYTNRVQSTPATVTALLP